MVIEIEMHKNQGFFCHLHDLDPWDTLLALLLLLLDLAIFSFLHVQEICLGYLASSFLAQYLGASMGTAS